MFEEFAQAKWARLDKSHSKKQPIAIDSLYFKDPLLDNNLKSKIEAIKLIGITDLFNHTGFAIQLNDYFHEIKMINNDLHKQCNIILKQNFKESPLDKIKHKLLLKIEDYLNDCSFK